MADLSKASNVVQEKYIVYDVTGFTQICHSIPVATSCKIIKLHIFYANISLKVLRLQRTRQLPVKNKVVATCDHFMLRSACPSEVRPC